MLLSCSLLIINFFFLSSSCHKNRLNTHAYMYMGICMLCIHGFQMHFCLIFFTEEICVYLGRRHNHFLVAVPWTIHYFPVCTDRCVTFPVEWPDGFRPFLFNGSSAFIPISSQRGSSKGIDGEIGEQGKLHCLSFVSYLY